jgi:hypothetical protein
MPAANSAATAAIGSTLRRPESGIGGLVLFPSGVRECLTVFRPAGQAVRRMGFRAEHRQWFRHAARAQNR